MEDLSGRKFGRWTVLKFVRVTPSYAYYWLCQCDCGTVKEVAAASLKHPKRQSCGCLQREIASAANRTHGMSRSSTYSTWEHMVRRCRVPGANFYHRYGGRGITVCDRWLKFENFFADMGERPKGKTIDRIDVDGPYTKDNCRWATDREQASNTTRNVFFEYDGVSLTLSEWSRITGVPISTMRNRMRRKGHSFLQVIEYLISKGKWDGLIDENKITI